MELKELEDILRTSNHEIAGLFTGVYTKPSLLKTHACVIKYILNILQSQTNSHERVENDQDLMDTVALFLTEYGVYDDLARAQEDTRSLFNIMDQRDLLAKFVHPRILDTPVIIGKVTHVNSQNLEKKISANFNEELDWEKSRERSRAERRKKKDDEQRQCVQKEYDAFIKSKGLPQTRHNTCIHREGFGKQHGENIVCDNIHVNMGKTVLLDGTKLQLFCAHKYGFVGPNGSGKTTLLRMLTAKELEGINPYLQIIHVEQEISSSDQSPLKIILDSDVERTQLLDEEQELLAAENLNSERLAQVYARMEEIDVQTAENRARTILRGLSFTDEMMTSPSSKLSGGWRMRVALAQALFIKPDVLLLDEPTNHLDLHAVLWLEKFLKKWDKTLVVVSHSRSFLNEVCTEIIHLEDRKLIYYKGDYNTFERSRTDRMQQRKREYEAQERSKSHMRAFVDRFRYSAARAAQAQSRLKAIDRLDKIAPVVEEARLKFDFPSPECAERNLLQVSGLSYQYKLGGRLIISKVHMNVDSDSRIGIVGSNGSGKSTFLKLLSEKLPCGLGQITRNPKARISMFSQHHIDGLNLAQTPLESMQAAFPKVEISRLRGHLSRFGLCGEKHLQSNYTLSGGQKSRLAFALMTYFTPDLLLLDEPTNHLDIDTVDALIMALNAYRGGVVIVSHDEHFISSVCDDLWVAEATCLNRFDDTFAVYKKRIQSLM